MDLKVGSFHIALAATVTLLAVVRCDHHPLAPGVPFSEQGAGIVVRPLAFGLAAQSRGCRLSLAPLFCLVYLAGLLGLETMRGRQQNGFESAIPSYTIKINESYWWDVVIERTDPRVNVEFLSLGMRYPSP
jgi:hypothetical protein